MTAAARSSSRRLSRLMRIVHLHWRLCLSGLVGLVMSVALPTEQLAPRLLHAWDIAVALYLILAYHVMARSDVGHIRQRAAIEDEGRHGILVLSVFAALASLGAIIVELGTWQHLGQSRQPTQLILVLLTIYLSWVFIHTIFAVHYAHEFYADDEGGGGLSFPNDDEPDYWDFVYFSFVVGMTSQVSDVAVTRKQMRRTVAFHGVISFIFNTALLALTINLAASALSPPTPGPM